MNTDTLEIPWGNRVYKKIGDADLIRILQSCTEYTPPVLNTIVRGKEMTVQIDGLFMVWAAVFLDEIEPEQLDWIDLMPKDSVYYDIGASVGLYSTYAALSDLEVLAFEPEAQNFAALEMHHALNSVRMKHPLRSFNLALGNYTDCSILYCTNYTKGAHGKTLKKSDSELKHRQSVTVFILDEWIKKFNLPVPEYIKIDVDGSEIEVMEGAKKTLKHPDLKEIFIETSDGSDAQRLIEDLGYTLKSKTQVEAYEGLNNYIFVRKQ